MSQLPETELPEEEVEAAAANDEAEQAEHEAVEDEAPEGDASDEAESDGDEAEQGGEPDDAEAEFAAQLRIVEALLFAAAEPLDEASLRKRLPKGARTKALLAALEDQYRHRGVVLKNLAGRWAFTTAPDLKHMLEHHREVTRKLSRAAVETLAIVAYHQPVTRAEIEEIRGVALSKGTLDVLMEAGWVKVRGRRRVPGRPITYGTSDEFLVHFGLESLDNLPGLDELRATGLLEALPASGGLPMPGEAMDYSPEDPLADGDDGREFLSEVEPLVDETETAGDAAAETAPDAEEVSKET